MNKKCAINMFQFITIIQFLITTSAVKSIKLPETRLNVNNSYDSTMLNNDTLILHRPLFPINRNKQLPFSPTNYKCNQKNSIVCQNKTTMFRDKILNELKTSMSNVQVTTNYYNVEFEPLDGDKYHPSCMILDSKVRYLTINDAPFDSSQFGYLFPKRQLFDGQPISRDKSCIIVSSAGSMRRSRLGKFIGM